MTNRNKFVVGWLEKRKKKKKRKKGGFGFYIMCGKAEAGLVRLKVGVVGDATIRRAGDRERGLKERGLQGGVQGWWTLKSS